MDVPLGQTFFISSKGTKQFAIWPLFSYWFIQYFEHLLVVGTMLALEILQWEKKKKKSKWRFLSLLNEDQHLLTWNHKVLIPTTAWEPDGLPNLQEALIDFGPEPFQRLELPPSSPTEAGDSPPTSKKDYHLLAISTLLVSPASSPALLTVH